MFKKFPRINGAVLLNGGIAAFALYFCMYAFRKPFSVATFEGLSHWGVDYKILLILAQVVGYMLAKFLGIKVISSLRHQHRPKYLLCMILMAELSLVLFALLPQPYNFVLFFFNGLALGMIWGIVFSYLEGRQTTEILSVILCTSFIVSSGAVKSVGLWVMTFFEVTPFWMPAVTGALFLLPFFVSLVFLERLTPPTLADEASRKKRGPMAKADRKKVLSHFALPMAVLVLFYVVLTALRDFRDNFSRELWDSMGYEDHVGIYTYSEMPIALLVLLLLGLFGLVKQNAKAFFGFHGLFILLCCFMALSTFLYQEGLLSPLLWMMAVGFGMYACYVPFNSIFFDRMIATFSIKGNAGFLIYIADAFGYLGSMVVLLYKNFGQANLSWLHFFTGAIYVLAVLGVLTSIVSLIFFQRKYGKIKAGVELNIANVNG
jgi:MFS family permease